MWKLLVNICTVPMALRDWQTKKHFTGILWDEQDDVLHNLEMEGK